MDIFEGLLPGSYILGTVSQNTVLLFSFAILLAFFVMFWAFWITWWLEKRPVSKSPYSGFPLRPGRDLSYYSKEMVLRYLDNLQQYDNRMFDFEYGAYCRETGRIFSHCKTWYGAIYVDWNFLQKRYPGTYVSWGSLNDAQQTAIRKWHDTFEGFQTEFSSKEPSPRLVESEFSLMKPGPLYVDLETKVLLGWKIVPNTELEVLIVQKPREIPKP